MPLPSLTQTLFGALLDSPALVEVTARVLEKAMPIIKEHFTLTADEITKAYQDACSYSFVAISIGLDAPDSLIKKVRHSKITREFAKQIEENYYKPFSEQNGVQSVSFVKSNGVQRFSFVKPLQKWAKKTDKLFKIKEITENDLSALIGDRKTIAISDLILAQMEKIEPVDETLAAFLRFNGLLGDSVLFFFREQFRNDARVQATQTALQQERLCIEVKNIQATLDDLKSTQEKHPFLSEQIDQQVQHLEQWQVQHEQLLCFQNRFADQLDEVLDWAMDVYTSLDEIKEDVAETKETVVKTHGLAEEMNRKLDDILTAQQQNHSAQINHRDGTVQYAPENRQLLKALLTQLQRLSPQNPLYGQVSNKAGRVLSSSGALDEAERLFVQLIEKATHKKDQALAYFNLFQVRWRKAFTATTMATKEQLYAQALTSFQKAIELDRAYALHDMSKDKGYYPIKKMLGAGGMGCAFLCQNHNFKIKGHQWVVVKCFWENISDNLEQLFQEPKTMHDIAGDYVPEILDYGYADNVHQTKPYFVSEYIEGAIDGEAWLEKAGCLDLTTGLPVAVQIAQALQQAHEKGICHLDLKPANLLLRKMDEKVSVKVIDFGLARVTTALSERAENRTSATVFGQAIFGTLDYAPPEQRGYAYRYGQPSVKSDVFAFGMTMYRLWTGKNPHPFRERDLPDHSALRDLLCDCVAENPEERPESALAVITVLEKVLQEINPLPTTIEGHDAGYWFDQADKQRKAGYDGDALISYDNALKIKPDYIIAWANRGYSLDRLGRNEDAIANYNRALQIKPDNAEDWLGHGNALGGLTRDKEAIASYDKALQIKPDYASAWNNRGISLKNLGKYEETVASFDKALQIQPDYALAWRNRGNSLQNLGKDEEAIASYDKALQIQPDYALAWFNRGISLQNLGKYEEAIASYDKVLQIQPDDADAWNNRGNSLGELGKYEEAIASYDKALEIQPDDAIACYNRGNSLGELGKYEEAIASYDKALEIQPDFAGALINRGNSLGELGKDEEAIASYDKALEIQPDYADAWNNRGISLKNLGKYEEAIASYDKALQIQPDDALAWNNRGWSLYKLERYKEAITNYDKALEIQPDYVLAWFNRGNSLSNLGKNEEAIASYDKALEIQPDYVLAWFNRGISLKNLGKHEEAIASYDKALQIQPDDADAWNNRGVTLENLRRYEEALKNYDKAIELGPQESVYLDNRKRILKKLGK
ncbi:MAG: tetratricopeptide repeat protein [Thiomargarita sp.]|nr:tetratricopeptide repeat protein [Thiomargarita sp.]